ncbi:CDP-glycerol glycerophosphotransferase family protein [Rhizobium sp. Leaf262]|uniref:CDP-glycerol glycerophosphotransferase family protein n=1 Tax=Rhizobium sp. Leaf262 TaxID=1736312 RepID=UPI0007139C92|nr:CDP-glycerol glycerophosphotransferase family protein [Rhizobium sp. Leaf262]KQO79762.1 hypothetical protein ASF29_22170 [Rhizobium sp. Leaf262]
MSDADLMPQSLTDVAASLDALREQMDVVSKQVEMQGEIQLEIAKLLQSLHSSQQSIPEQIIGGVDACLKARDGDKLPVTKDVFSQLDARLSHLMVGMHTLKQVSNLTLREIRPTEQVVRVVFIVQSIPMWDALVGVYQAMVDDERFHPMVVSINHSQLGRGEFTGEMDVHKGLDLQGIPHLRMNVAPYDALDILRSLQPDVVFRQQQWDVPVPAGLRTNEITFARICVVPYGMGVLANPEAKNEEEEAYEANYDQNYHRMAWRVFCETEQTQTYYRSFQHSDPEKFILSGYPKLGRLLEERGQGEWPLAEPNGRTFRVIWAPHHSLAVHGAGFGVFHEMHADMLEWARSSPDIQFVFKPHPALDYSAPRSGVLTQQSYNAFQQSWSDLPNCTICRGDYAKLFDASDLMLTDGVSFLTEYHLFRKPLIFIDSGVHAAFNALGRLAERAAHRVHTFQQMKQAALDYKQGKTWQLEEEREELLNVLLPSPVPATRVILDSIFNGIHT